MKGVVPEKEAAEIKSENKEKPVVKQERLTLIYEEKEDEEEVGKGPVLEVLMDHSEVISRS